MSNRNPQNDIQAQARAHRIGQTKSVKVYRLLTRKTYEMHLFQVASMKLGLDYAVMHNVQSSYNAASSAGKHAHHQHHQQQDNKKEGEDGDADASARLLDATSAPASAALSKKEIENLLKRGAYDMFREENEGKSEQESKTFCEADIDQILERSTHIVHDASASGSGSGAKITGTQGGTLGGALNSFSKASFVSSKEIDDVAVDDPQFWEKVMGLSKAQEEEEKGAGKRKRKCRDTIGSYHEDALLDMAKRAGAGMTIQPLGKGSTPADLDDSDFSSSSDGGGEGRGVTRRRIEAASPESIFAVTHSESEAGKSSLKSLESKCDFDRDLSKLSAEVVESIFLAMNTFGFGNWGAICMATQLKWSVSEMAFVCALIVLQLVKHTDPHTSSAAKAGDTKLSKAGVEYYCKASASKLVHCALAAAEFASVGHEDNTDVCGKAVNELLTSRYSAARAAATNKTSTRAVDWDPKKPVYDLLGNMLDPTACVSALRACTQYVGINVTSFQDDTLRKPDERTNVAESLHSRISALLQPGWALPKFSLTSMKAKYQNLETMFELYVAMKAAGLPEFSSLLEDEDNSTGTHSDVVHRVLRKANAFISMFWYEFLTIEDMPDSAAWWTYRHDALLVALAAEVSFYMYNMMHIHV
jgi:hypothetical protein